MKVCFLGTGTSQGIPVIGCRCATCLSHDPKDKRLRCSALVTDANTTVVIDVGPDFRQQMLNQAVSDLDAVFLTHEHNDHIIGLDDLRPFIFKRRTPMKIYGEDRVLQEVKTRFAYAFGDQRYPGAPAFELIAIKPGDQVMVGKLTFEALRIYHAHLPILGYRIVDFAYLTDVSLIPPETYQRLEGLKMLVISALRHKPHHSHLSLKEAVRCIQLAGAERGLLIHMSHLMGPAEEWIRDLPENIQPAYDNLVINLPISDVIQTKRKG